MLPTLQLTDAFKGYTYDQDKLMTPEETNRRVRERLAALDLEILAETRRSGLIVNSIDGAKLDALIAELYRIPQDVVDAARSTVGFGAR